MCHMSKVISRKEMMKEDQEGAHQNEHDCGKKDHGYQD